MIEVRREVAPRSPLRLPGGGADGVLRRRGSVLERLLHVGDEPVVVRAAQPGPWRVVLGARAATAEAAEEGIARMRFALGVDDDLRPFLERFRHDPLIGPSVRRRPWVRPRRRPEPFESLAWAVTEQLIEVERAHAIQRRIIGRLGRSAPGWDPATTLRDVPTPEAVAGAAPAWLQSCDLAAGRAIALVRAAREVARGRVDLRAADPEPGWRRLMAIPGIGRWTIEMLALHGQGRYDRIPAGDLGYLKLVGRLRSGGDPRAVAEEDDVRAVFARYGEWAGLAGLHALAAAASPVTTAAVSGAGAGRRSAVTASPLATASPVAAANVAS